MKTPHTVFQNRRLLKLTRTLIVLLVAAALFGLYRASGHSTSTRPGTSSEGVLDPTAAPVLPGTFAVVNDGFGDQTDPRIGCDLASYINDDFFGARQIRYFDFATNTDHEIPGNGTGMLSDGKLGLVVFTEGTANGPVIVLFDIATQARSQVPGFQNSHPAVGGNLVVFENRSFSSNPNESEISVYDLSTGTVTRLTNDNLFDKNPRISSTGNAIVWEKCQTNGSDCDIYSAIQTAPGVFTTNAL